MAKLKSQQFYTASQIAKLCRSTGLTTTHKTVLNHRKRGYLQQVKKDDATGAYRWSRSKVEDYLMFQHGLDLDEIENKEGGSDE